MKLSIVILNYNVRYFLELCLKSVEAAIQDIDAEIIVVDNNSPDDSCDMIKQLFSSVQLIENRENSGFSKGNNIGVAQAKGEYLCILNPDTVVAENTFSKVLQFAESKDKLGIVGCQLIDGKGEFLPESKRHVPTAKIAFQKMIGNAKHYYTNELDKDAEGHTDILVGAFMVLKRNVYNKVGGFDEDYFMYGEDIDLSYKVLKAGYTNYYFGKISALHFKGESTLKDNVYAKRFFDAMEIFYRKHFKKNSIFSALIGVGTKLGYLLKGKATIEIPLIESYVFVSSQSSSQLESAFKHKITSSTTVNSYKENTEYILDNNHLSFKSIIEILSNRPKKSSSTFKILPKNSNFILGSNSSKSRGEVKHF